MINPLDNSCIDTSPCVDCPNHKAGVNKDRCIPICERLLAYQNGASYKDLPYPEITKKIKENKVVKNSALKDYGPPPAKIKNPEKDICVLCHNPDKPILNKRSQTCRACYLRWRKGVAVHPTLGKFVKSQTHYKPRSKASAKKQTAAPSAPVNKANTHLSITLNMNKYPKINKIIRDTADRFLLPVEHIVIGLLAQGIKAAMGIKHND